MADKKAGAAVPAWMVTFADLMALMMTFFVLLYSFSSMDEQKYRMIAASMAKGFGSVLAQKKASSRSSTSAPPAIMPNPMSTPQSQRRIQQRQSGGPQNRKIAENLKNSLQDQIAKGVVAVESSGDTVVIRFPEEVAFPPGSDTISDEMLPLLLEVVEVLKDAPGTLMVSGHTDDRPIKSQQFGSNWELSTDRAVSVIHRLEELGAIDADRLTAAGYGDTRPLVPNDSPENRAKNRRVEIAIIQEQ